LEELDFERGVWSAALNGDLDKLRKYLDGHGDPNALDSAGYTPLHYAARHNQLSAVRLLLDCGACANVRTRSGLATPLHKAAHSGHCDVIQLLLSRGQADLTLQDCDGKTALEKAKENNKTEAVQLLSS